jgi:hypothetical protein
VQLLRELQDDIDTGLISITGKPASDLSDEEIADAVVELGVGTQHGASISSCRARSSRMRSSVQFGSFSACRST